MNQPPLFPAHGGQRNPEFPALCIRDQYRHVHRRRARILVVAPAVAVTPHLDGIEAAGDGDRLRGTRDDRARGAGSGGISKLASGKAPHLLLAAAAEFARRPVKQLQRPTLEVLKIHQSMRVLLPLGPRHFIRLLANFLPRLNLIHRGHNLLRLAPGLDLSGSKRERGKGKRESPHSTYQYRAIPCAWTWGEPPGLRAGFQSRLMWSSDKYSSLTEQFRSLSDISRQKCRLAG